MDQETVTIQFEPATNEQKGFIESTKEFSLLSGGVGSGKSFSGCWKGVAINLFFPGSKGLIVRKAGVSLRESTLHTLRKKVLLKEMVLKDNLSAAVIIHRTIVPGVSSEIHWTGLDKTAEQSYPTKIGSTEYTWIFVDEGVELTREDWEMLSTRTRYVITENTFNQIKNTLKFKYDYDTYVNNIPHLMFTATNPDSPKHWLYKFFFEDKRIDREVFFMRPRDNPYLPREYLDKLERTLTGIQKIRLLDGKWVQAEGVIYKDFDLTKHVMNDDDMLPEYSFYKNFIFGSDSNYPLPRAGVLIGIRGDGRRDLIDEFYEPEAEVEEIIAWMIEWQVILQRRLTCFQDPSDAQSIAKIDKAPMINCYKALNAVNPGINTVAGLFKSNRLFVHEDCINIIAELQSYCWKQGSKEVPQKKDDHLMDALRYALYSEAPRTNFSRGYLI